MAEDNNYPGGDRRPLEPKTPARFWVLMIVLAASIPLLMLLQARRQPAAKQISQPKLLSLVRSNLVEKGVISYSSDSRFLQTVSGRYREVDAAGKTNLVHFFVEARLTDDIESVLVNEAGFTPQQSSNIWLSIFIQLLPILLIGFLVWFFFIRQLKAAGRGALSFGKSKARLLSKDKNKTTFKDVAG
ncbi:MAG: cell division protein FtsH, partial [Verrucomicrobiota bacterium]